MRKNETADYVTRFTLREEELLTQVRQRQLVLPERLQQWTLWIQDPALYLSELAEFVRSHTEEAPAPPNAPE